MKKIIIAMAALSCVLFFVSAAVSGETGESMKDGSWFKPSLSVGYIFDAGDIDCTFNATAGGIGGVVAIDSSSKFSGVYLGGELPFSFTERLKLTLAGSWAYSSSEQTDEIYNNHTATPLFRSWDSDTSWVTADLLVSFAFLKNISFIKDFSVAAGCRFDNHSMSSDTPNNVLYIATSLPTDTAEFDMWTLTPVVGLDVTFEGFKLGSFGGGNIRIGAIGGPILWGDLENTERFGGVVGDGIVTMDGDLDGEYFYEILAEFTAVSFDISETSEVSLSFFGKYSDFRTEDDVTGVFSTLAAGVIATDTFRCEIDRELIIAGMKVTIGF